MFREAHCSLSGALTVFAASCLHTHRCLIGCGASGAYAAVPDEEEEIKLMIKYLYVNQRLQINLELLMMSGVPLETC
jgi:hypothetical protein